MVKKIIAHFVLVSFVLSQNVFAMDTVDGSGSTPSRFTGNNRGNSRSVTPGEQAADPSPSDQGTPRSNIPNIPPLNFGNSQPPTPINGVVVRSQTSTPSRALTFPLRDLTGEDFVTLPSLPQKFSSPLSEKYKFLGTVTDYALSGIMAMGTSFAAQKAFDVIPGLNAHKKQFLTAISFLFGAEAFMQNKQYFSQDPELSVDPAFGRGPAATVAIFVVSSMITNFGSLVHNGLSFLGFDPLSYITPYIKIQLPQWINVTNVTLAADALVFLKNRTSWVNPFESSTKTEFVEQLHWFQKWVDQASSTQIQTFNRNLVQINNETDTTHKVKRLVQMVEQGQAYKEDYGSRSWFGQHANLLKTAGIMGITTAVCVLAASAFKKDGLSLSNVAETAQSFSDSAKGQVKTLGGFFKNLFEEAPKAVSNSVAMATSSSEPSIPVSSWILFPLSIKAALGFADHLPDMDLNGEIQNLRLLLRKESVLLQSWVKGLDPEVQQLMNINSIVTFLNSRIQITSTEEQEEEIDLTDGYASDGVGKNLDNFIVYSANLQAPLPQKVKKIKKGAEPFKDLATDSDSEEISTEGSEQSGILTPNDKLLKWGSSSESGSNVSSRASSPASTPSKFNEEYISDE